MAAVETLRAIQSEQRPATAGEQQVLARWSGWGAVPRLFDPTDTEFTEQRERLRTLLSDTDFAHARRSTLNAHYTDAGLVAPIWQAVTDMGVRAGRVLEPGCGSGNFIGLAPAGMALSGVELEPTTAGIAAALYPHAEILTGSFANATTSGQDAFDAVVGNVPFGRMRLHDPEHNPDRHPIHTHFILKSLRMATPGAPVALVTSRYVMDAVDDTARSQIAELADLVSAVRLPSAAHQTAAGTSVVTDVLLLRRRPEGQPPQHAGPFQQVSSISVPDRVGGNAQLQVNELFHQQPQRVLGTLASDSGRYGQPDLIVPNGPSDLGSALTTALSADVDRARQQGLSSTTVSTVSDQKPIPLQTAVRDDGRFEGVIGQNSDGSFARWSQGIWHEHSVPKTQARELSHLLGLRDTAQALLAAENSTSEDTDEIAELRTELNTRYDTYRQHYPPVNRFSWKTRTLPGWTVFGRWCEQQQRDKLPASAETILGYLQHLADEGLDQDRLRTHLQAMTDRHARKEVPLTAETRDSAEAIVRSCPTEASSALDPVALGLVTEARQSPPQGGFRTDPLSSLVRALEDFDPVNQTAHKADIFHQRVVAPRQNRTRAATPADALSICLNNHAQVHLDVIAELLQLDGPEAAHQVLTSGQHPLAFTDPDTGDVHARNDYLSGNVRAKLATAQAAAEGNAAFDGHVAALREVVPATRGPEEIEIQLGSWIEAPYVQQFLRDILDDPAVRVDHPGARLWVVNGGNERSTATRETWGTEQRSAQQLTESLLNGRPIRITYTDPAGNLLTDAPATEQAQAQAAAISERFNDWVWEDPQRADELVTLYNDRFNAHIPRVYDDVELTLPGLSDAAPTLRPHQKAAVAAQIFNPAFGLYHEVGAGKTLEMIIGAMERKRLGLTARQVFNIPNHMLEQFEREWLRAYPQANLLTASRDELSGNRRRDFVARAATGDYDAVILTEGAFRALAVSPEVEERFIAAERDEIQQALTAARTGDCTPRTIKELEEQLARAEEAVKGRLAKIDRDPGLCWDDLDFDTVIVDESQRFKNSRRFSSLPSMGHPGSDRATDLDMKLDDLVFKHGHARYVSATATPFTNSLAEIYTELGRLGADLPDLDSWARTWGKLTTSQEMVPGGSYKEITRLRELLNAPELALQLRQHADIRTAEDLNLPTPNIAGGGPQILTIEAPTELGDFNAELADRYQKLKPRPGVGDDNHLSLINEAISSALDMRLVGRGSTEPQKVDVLVDRIWQRWLEHRDDVYLQSDGTEHPTRGSLQLVFCSLSTPKRDQWNVYDEIRNQLADRGMPRELVRYIHEAHNDQQKAELFAAARSGDIAVLIGSSEKMGTGTNVQTRAIGLYQLSPPWRADIPRQEIGRVVRPGNHNTDVFVEQLVTAPSLETKKWKIVRDKDNGFRPLMTGNISSRHLEMPDEDNDHFAELMAAASGDPRILEKAELESHVNRLLRLQQAWSRQQSSHRLTLSRVETEVPQLAANRDQLETALGQRRETSGEQFAMTLGGQHYTSRSKAAGPLAERLLDAVEGAPKDATPAITLGELGGFTLTVEIRRWHLYHSLAFYLDGVPGALTLHHSEVSPSHHGLITRLENWISKLDEQRDLITSRITRIREDAEQARELLGKPFSRQAELDEAQQRLADLASQLADTSEQGQDPTEQDAADEHTPAATPESTATTRSTSPSPSAEPASDSPPGEVIGTVIDGDGTTRSFEVPGVASDSAPSAPDAPPEHAAAGATDRADRERTAATDDSDQQDTSHAAAADAAVSETRGPDELVPDVSTPAVSVRTDTAAMVGRVLRLREHAVRIEAIAEHATDHRDDTIRVGGQDGEVLLPEADLAPYTSTDSRVGTVLSWRGLRLQVTWSGRYAALVGWRSGQQSSVLVHIDDGEVRLSSLTAGGLREGLSRWLDDLPSEASWARAEVEALGTRTPAASSERQPQQGDPPAERDETAATAEAPGEQNPPAPTERTPAGEQTGVAASPNAAPPEPAPESAPSTSSVDAAAEQLVPAHSVPLPSVRRGQHTLHLSREHGLVLLGIREGADHPRSLLKDQKAIDLKIGRWEKLNSGVWRAVGTQGQPHTAELLQRARNVLVRLSVTQRIEARMDLHLDVPREREAQQVLDKRTVLSQIYGLVRNALATATIHDVPLVPPHQLDQPTAAPAAPEQPSQGTRDPGAAEEPALDLGLTDPAESGPDTGEQAGAPAPSTRAGRTEDEPQPDSTPEPTGLASESGTPSTSVVVHASREHGLQLRNGTVSTLAVENARDRQVPFESWRVVLTGSDQGTWHVPGTAGKAITADQIDHLAALTRFLRSERGLAVELDVHREDLADDAETHGRWRQHAGLLAPHDTSGTEPDIADTEPEPADREPTATQDTAEPAEPAEPAKTADGEQDQLRQVVSELLGRHHLEHVEGAQQALIGHVRAELADPWLSQLALVNDRDNYAMQVSARLADRFVEATMASSNNDPDRLMRPLTADDSPLRDELSDWFADYSYTLLNHTNEAETDASSESATDDQRVLRLHYSDEHGLLLLGSQREDGLGPVLRSKRAAWKHRASIVGPDPDNAAGAWFLQNTRNREFAGRNADQRRTQYRHRLESEVIDALEHLAEAGHTVRMDVRDLPTAVINRLQRHHGRRHSADAASTPAASDELADAPEPASTEHDEQDPAQLPTGADEQHNPSEVSSDNEQPDRAASASDPDPFRSNTPDSAPTAQPRARATQVEEPTLFGPADEPRESSNIPAQEHESSGDASIVTTTSTASAAAEEPDGQPAPPAEPDSAADPVGAAGRGDEELIRAHELAVREEERGLLRVCEPGLPAAGVVFGHPEDGWTSPQGDPVELGVWVAAYRQRAPRAGIAALIKLDVELASRASALATRVIAPGTDTARTNLALALGLARGGDTYRTIEGWVSAAERDLLSDEAPEPAPTQGTAAPAAMPATSAPAPQPTVESAPAEPPARAPAEDRVAAVEQPAEQAARGHRAPDDPVERIAWLNAHAAAWFDQQLQQSALPQDYLRQRLGTDEAVELVRARLTVGWAPDTWTGLTRHLQQLQGPDGARAVSDEDLVTAGLAKRSSRGGVIDVFRGRLVFAFTNGQGQLAGFTGRIHPALVDARNPERTPKYLNTPATPAFRKGTLLLGAYEQREQIAGGADVVLCEGPLDAAAILATAHAAGDDTLVPLAASGTAITNQHLDQLHSLAQARVIHALDADAATGDRGLDLLHRSLTRLPHEQHVTQLPHGPVPSDTDPDEWSGHDPATWALTHGRESLSTYRPSSDYCQPALTPLVDARLSQHRLDETDGQVNAAHAAAALLAELDPNGPHAASVFDEAARVAPLLLYEPGDMAGLLVHYRSLPAGTSRAEARASFTQHRHLLESAPDEPADLEDAEVAEDEPLAPAESDTSAPADTLETESPEAGSALPQPAVEVGKPDVAPVLVEHDAEPVSSEKQEPAAADEPEAAPTPQQPVVVHHSHDYGSLLWGPDQAWLADALSTARLQGARVGAWTYDPDVARPDGGQGAWRIRGTAGHLAPPEAVTLLHNAQVAITTAGVPAELDLAATEATGPARALLTSPEPNRTPARDHADAPAGTDAGARSGAGPRARGLSSTEQAAISALDPDEIRTPDEHTQLALTELAGRWVLHAATVTSANNPLAMTSSFTSYDAAHAAAETMTSHTLPDIARRAVTNQQATGELGGQPLPAQLTPAGLATFDRTLAADRPSHTHGPRGTRTDACARATNGLTVPVGTVPASPSTTPPASPPSTPTVEHPQQQQPRERAR